MATTKKLSQRSITARERSARLAIPGFPLKGGKRLQPFKGVEVEGTYLDDYRVVNDKPPTSREYAHVDRGTAKRKTRRKTRRK